MQARGVVLTAIVALGLCGCIISTQDGERKHVNMAFPEEIAFHFDTPFNRVLLFGRSALLLLVPAIVFRFRGKGSDLIAPALLAAVCLAASVWIFHTGWMRLTHYRIEVGSERLTIRDPSSPDLEIPWQSVQAIDVTGIAHDVRIADGQGHGLKWAPEWEDLTIELGDGTTHDVDLRPLSVEQRGTLWRAISRKAGLDQRIETISETGSR